MTEPEKMSFSKLFVVQDCGEAARRKYVEGEREPTTLRMARGLRIHAIAAEAHRRQLDTKRQFPEEAAAYPVEILRAALPSREEVRDLAATAFDTQMATEDISVLPDEVLDAGSRANAVGATKDHVLDASAHYVREVAPKINPVAVDRRIEIFPQDSNVRISMELDVVEHSLPGLGPHGPRADGQPVEIVRDQKTGTKSPNPRAALTSQQLTMYALGRAADPEGPGRLPDLLVLDHLIRTPKRHDVYHSPQYTTRNEADIRALIHRINAAVEAFRAGIFVPAQPGTSWRCSPKWCGFWPTCRFVNPERG